MRFIAFSPYAAAMTAAVISLSKSIAIGVPLTVFWWCTLSLALLNLAFSFDAINRKDHNRGARISVLALLVVAVGAFGVLVTLLSPLIGLVGGLCTSAVALVVLTYELRPIMRKAMKSFSGGVKH